MFPLKKKYVLLLYLLFFNYSGKAQVRFHVDAGVGYLEHFSAGIGCSFSSKHNVSLLYGSDFFVRPKDFASYLLQYNLILPRLRFAGITPTIGLKGGHTIYTDDYYRWEVAVIIPFAGLQYPINKKINAVVQAGVVFSFEQSVKRIDYGEIGHYKDLLPEIKTGIVYTFSKQ
jgi:hypothetical protein